MLKDFQHTAKDDSEAAIQALTAGVDLEASSNCYWACLLYTSYFRYMWIHASAVPGDAPQEVKDIVYPIGPGQGIIVASDVYKRQIQFYSMVIRF